MKKILLSLSSIAAVAAIVAVGSTGAWWTDTADSSNNTFHSGSMDLHLSNDGDNWSQNVKKTWKYDNMYPGGDSMGDKLYIANGGSTPADWLKISATTDPTDENENMDKHMRITKLAYAGESLLEDGAGANGGADLSSYEPPQESDCDVDVNFGDNDYNTISGALEEVEEGQLICVGAGNYSQSYEGNFPITIDTKDVTVASMVKPDGEPFATLNGEGQSGPAVAVNANGVTLKGFQVKDVGDDGDDGLTGQGVAINTEASGAEDRLSGITLSHLEVTGTYDKAVVVDFSDNVTLSNLYIHDNAGADWDEEGPTSYVADGVTFWGVNNSEIKHATVHNNGDNGVYFNGNNLKGEDILAYKNGDEGVDISLDYNNANGPVTIKDVHSYDNGAEGIEVEDNEEKVTIKRAIVENNGQEGEEYKYPLKLTNDYTDSGGNANVVIQYSNLKGKIVNQSEQAAINATKNWWGDYDPSDQIEGNVNANDNLGGPHVGFVNGNDYNDNGFADLHDLYAVTDYEGNPIAVEEPELETDRGNKRPLNLQVQLDGPKADADDQDSKVGLDVTIEMGQGPVNQ